MFVFIIAAAFVALGIVLCLSSKPVRPWIKLACFVIALACAVAGVMLECQQPVADNVADGIQVPIVEVVPRTEGAGSEVDAEPLQESQAEIVAVS